MSKGNYDLSIIIVSYNAIDFLKLTLDSVEKAISTLNAEVLLVDNSNNKNLKETVRNNYPFVKLIDNSVNLGFSKGNNLALKQAKGKLALLLNPDTVVPEDAFTYILHYYQTHPETGGLGLKMLDGKGSFLPESKRGFPSLSVSIFKLCRLHKFFPDSKIIAKYYEGHLDHNSEQNVDVLSGACMVIPRGSDGTLSFLDESYFMYGEDIDLSYRLKLKHGNNIYYPKVSIIHFKGQSTKTDVRIIKHFYNAMWLFYKQHIKPQKSVFTTSLTWIGIKTMTCYKILISKLSSSNPENCEPPSYNSVRLISDNDSLSALIGKQLNTQVTVSGVNGQSINGQLTIFDFNSITYKEAIGIMANHTDNYGFMTRDLQSLIICQNPSEKGMAIHL
ncbi:glycosyltransferase family 2 protein [Carboxylicivirga sp. RSCT41]|uniref:glycosyltransferase family 2 protein n=1 Tax=Carboxylicivirga agarovorans TaxID=3417570 RepID=UPI003D3364C1